jgi:hypothetical protein
VKRQDNQHLGQPAALAVEGMRDSHQNPPRVHLIDSKALHQFGKRDVERPRDLLNIPKRNVAYSALDAADVRAIEVALSCEFFLRQFGAQSQFTYSTPKSDGDVRPLRH